MTRGTGVVACALILVALVICATAVAAAARNDDATAGQQSGSAADCPCFDPTRLTELPGEKWDLCIDTGTTVQIAKWFRRRGTEGKEGFNVLASQTSSRTAGGSCRFVWRYREDGEMKQEYSRVLDLIPSRAASCHEMLRSWLESRGGCDSEVAER